MKYTTILFDVKKEFDITLNEYALLNNIYYLQTNPNSKIPGWYYGSKDYLAAEINITRQSIHNIINRLIDKNLLEKNDKGYLRITQLWYEKAIHFDDDIDTDVSKKFTQSVKKVDTDVSKKFTQSVKKVDTILTNKETIEDNKETLVNDTMLLWNKFAKENNLSTIISLSDKRKKHIKKRLQEKLFNLDKIFEQIRCSRFLLGKAAKWKVDFDFIFTSENNYLKILEGKYADNKSEHQIYSKPLTNIINEQRTEGFNQF